MSFVHNQPAWSNHDQSLLNHQVQPLILGPYIPSYQDEIENVQNSMRQTVESTPIYESTQIIDGKEVTISSKQYMFDLTSHHLLARKLLKDRSQFDIYLEQLDRKISTSQAINDTHKPARLIKKVDKFFKNQ